MGYIRHGHDLDHFGNAADPNNIRLQNIDRVFYKTLLLEPGEV